MPVSIQPFRRDIFSVLQTKAVGAREAALNRLGPVELARKENASGGHFRDRHEGQVRAAGLESECLVLHENRRAALGERSAPQVALRQLGSEAARVPPDEPHTRNLLRPEAGVEGLRPDRAVQNVGYSSSEWAGSGVSHTA
ncbi:MAG: hypothetical protein AAGI50_00620 [Pseudomonadota bacterium]